MPEFHPASAGLPRARAILDRERERVSDIPDAILELTGGSSVAGALTGGDVDLHLRVPSEGFEAAVALLRERYEVVHPEIWSAILATFQVPGDELVGVAVTPIGSEHDLRFRRAWERLRVDPGALAAYNTMKRAHAQSGDARYLAAKAAFFEDLASRAPEGAPSGEPSDRPDVIP